MAYFDVNPLLAKMLDVAPGISDLNLSVGKPPQVEVEGQLRPVPFAGMEKLAPYHVELVAMRLLRGKRDLTERLLRTGSVDLSYSLAQKTRFRVNVFAQRGSYSVVLRVIPNKIPTVEELGLPKQLNRNWLVVHVTHAAAMRHCRRGFGLRLLRYHRLGCDEKAGYRGCIL